MSGYILAIDQGTTSTRAILFDGAMKVAGVSQQEFPQHFPSSGWVEHDPEDLWRTSVETARAALAKAGISASALAGVGVTNQRETTIVWDRTTGKPIANAIVWQDRRTAEVCARLRDEGREPLVTRQDRAPARPLLFRHEDRVDPRRGSRRARARRARRARLRHRGQLPHLAVHRRQIACHRRHQRLPDIALRHPRRTLGRRASRPVWRAQRHDARGPGLRQRIRRDGPLHPRRACIPARRRRRPAGGDGRVRPVSDPAC